MLKRIITGALLVVVIAGFFLLRTLSPAYFVLLTVPLSALGSFEVARAFGGRLTKPQIWLAPIFSALVAACPALALIDRELSVIAAVVALALSVAAQLSAAVFSFEKISVEGLGLGILAAVYPSALLACMGIIDFLPAYSGEALLIAFLVPSFADTFAFFAGSLIGGKKLCPSISPKKTVAGAVGGLAGGAAGAVIVWLVSTLCLKRTLPAWWFFLIVGAVTAVFTEFGDLVESVIKRKIGIKDMGKILPGHGGIMDRIDGISFACPVVLVLFLIPLAF